MDNYKKFAIDSAYQAGKIIKSDLMLKTRINYKNGYSPVTASDLKINRLVIEAVKRNYPDHGVLAEEESNLNGHPKNIWVCDPIDGTIPFSHGIPISTFSLALVSDGEPILGVVYDPFMDRLFFAEKGRGASLNNKKIQVSNSTDFNKEVVVYEAWSRARYDLMPVIKHLSEQNLKTMMLCSIIYGSMMVAAGEFMAAIFPGIYAHDVAATKIIVEEAGGRVTDLFGKDQRYDQEIKGTIISNGIVHEQLVETVSKLIKER